MRVVYHSFEGRYSDSPRAIHRALRARGGDLEHLWLTHPGQHDAFPDDLELLEYGSPACVDALASCDLLVANTHTDFEWSKPPGCLYVQTWHGTPLKRIHWDVLWAPEGRLERLQRDVDRWDLLLSPNPVSTPLLRRAFRFDREVLESGYPRNDALHAANRDEVRARVRHELGIADGQTAVLYTPTWRDDVVFSEGGKTFALELDVAQFADRLGSDHVLLLRLHRMLGAQEIAAAHHGVRDVSQRPEVSELYLAADVMVTDYSSTMFDFAITGKPMLFYTYDLDDFAGRLRGLYLDLVAEAPGPLLATTNAVIDALRDLPALTRAYAPRYTRFTDRFCGLEDGHATDRVTARLAEHLRPVPGLPSPNLA